MATASLSPDVLDSLTKSERRILDFFDRAKHPKLFLACRTIARKLGCCLATVERALRRFKALGLVEVVANYALTTRREIVLRWRDPAASHQPPMIEQMSDHGAAEMSDHPAAPLNRSPEGHKELVLSSSEGHVAPEASAESPRTTTTEDHQPLTTGTGDGMGTTRCEGRKATPEEVREVVAEAESLFGEGADRKARAAARTHGLSRVRTALQWARRRNAGSWGYVLTALTSWDREGAVAAIPAGPATSAANEKQRRIAAAFDSAPLEMPKWLSKTGSAAS